jgi:hypothetical protein
LTNPIDPTAESGCGFVPMKLKEIACASGKRINTVRKTRVLPFIGAFKNDL